MKNYSLYTCVGYAYNETTGECRDLTPAEAFDVALTLHDSFSEAHRWGVDIREEVQMGPYVGLICAANPAKVLDVLDTIYLFDDNTQERLYLQLA